MSQKQLPKRKQRLGLTTKIFIGLVAGALVGIALNLFAPPSEFLDKYVIDGLFFIGGQGFIRLMKLLVVPLVFFSIVVGASAIGDFASLGKVGGKTLGFYIATTALAITIALYVAFLGKPGINLAMEPLEAETVAVSKDVSLAQTLLNIIPDNPFHSFADGTMLQVIFFALLVGLLIAKMGERVSSIATLCKQSNELMMEMTTWIMNIAPIGVFCLIARAFSNLGYEAFGSLVKYMSCVSVALFIQCFVVYSLLLFLFTRLNPFQFFKRFFPVMAFAFSTSTSNATIPMNIEYLEERVGVSRKTSSFTIPLGATINMDGTSIMQGVAVVFAAQAYGIDLTLLNYLTVIATATLASIGTAGIPSVGLVTLAMVLQSVNLPVEAIGLIIGVDRILDMLRTAVNVTGDAIVTVVVAKQNGELDRSVFLKN